MQIKFGINKLFFIRLIFAGQGRAADYAAIWIQKCFEK
jgi:hypothetical protein